MLSLSPLTPKIASAPFMEDFLNSAHCFSVDLHLFPSVLNEAALMTIGLGTNWVKEDCQFRIVEFLVCVCGFIYITLV